MYPAEIRVVIGRASLHLGALVTPTSTLSPAAGDVVTATIDGHLCGRGLVTDTVADNQLAYQIQVSADSGKGCGAPGREMLFSIGGQTRPNSARRGKRHPRW